MYLDYIKITSEIDELQTLIRYVKFKKGLNFISDITDMSNKTSSGNNIGKSTFLELIDICLGKTSIDSIYSDRKTKGINQKVKKFLENKRVFVELSMNINNHTFTIKRSLYDKGKEIYFNGKKQKNIKDLKSILNKYIFHNKINKPSIRDLLVLFIRKEEDAIKSPLDIFMDRTEDEKKYKILVFLFGWENIELLLKLSNLKISEKKIKKDMNVFKRRLENPSAVETLLKTINESINEYKKQLSKLKFTDELMEALKNKDIIDINIINLKNNRLNLEYNINKHKESLELLENNISNITESEINSLYNEAKRYLLNDISKDFKKLILFHNESINNEKEFIQDNLNNLNEKLKSVDSELKKNIDEKIEIEAVNNILGIENEINKLENERGKYLNEKSKWDKINNERNNLYIETNKIKDNIIEYETIFKEKLDKFNEIYKHNQLLLNPSRVELLVVTYDEKKGIDIISTEGRKGTGSKMKDTLLFNISYAQFVNEYNLNFPTFFLFDCSELIHENTRDIIFSDLIKDTNMQLISPVLTSSLPDSIKNEIDNYSILRLSEKEKLFKIEIIEEIYPMIAQGLNYAKENKFEKAKNKFKEVLDIDPNRDDVNYFLGLMFVNDKDNYDENMAAKYFQKALEINPHNYRALKDLGVYKMANISIDEGIKYFFDAIKIKPDYKEAYSNLEDIYDKILKDNNLSSKYGYILDRITLEAKIGCKIEISLKTREYRLDDKIINLKSVPELSI